MHQNYFIYTPILVLSLVFGIYILTRKIRNASILSLGALILSLAVWVFCLLITDTTQDYQTSLLWARLAIIGPSFIPAFFLYFTFNFPKPIIKGKIVPLFFVLLPALLFTSFSLTSLNVQQVIIYEWGAEVIPGIFYPLLLLYFFVFFGVAFYNLFKSYKIEDVACKERIKYIFVGAVLAILLGITTNLILVQFGFSQMSILGPFSSLLFTGFIAFAILKHNLLDIRVIIGRTAAYVITITLFGVGYLLLTLAYVNLFSSKVDFGFLGMTIVYGILVGEFFQRVRFLVQTTAEKAFLKGKYDYRGILSRMSEKLAGCKTMGDISAVLEGDFKGEVEAKNISVYLMAVGRSI